MGGPAGAGWDRGEVRSVALALGDGSRDGLLDGCRSGQEGDEESGHLGLVAWRCGSVRYREDACS